MSALRGWMTLLGLLSGLLGSSTVGWSQTLVPRPDPQYQNSNQPVRRWALIIGVKTYSKEPNVEFAANDAHLIATTLVTSGDYRHDNMLMFVDNPAISESIPPTFSNLTDQIPKWIGNIGRNDVVFVYFSGHGDTDNSGHGILCPSDYDRNKPGTSGISLSWIHSQLSNCLAKQKILVLDCCHAGSTRAVSVRARQTSQFLVPLNSASGLVTLASCRADELSYQDKRKQLGIFTSQMANGLRGGADLNRNGLIDSEELYQWCSERVPPIVLKQHSAEQHPDRHRVQSDIIDISRTQFAPSVDELVERKNDAVFRVSCLSDRKWTVRGSAFAISYVRSKLYLVTLASILEDDEGRMRSPDRIRLTGRDYTFTTPPSQVLIHSQRKQSQGPDVAIIEMSWNDASTIPRMFNLRTQDDNSSLSGRECAFLAYPNRQDVDATSPPEYASGKLTTWPGPERLNYQSSYPNEADGAPLFVVDDQSERGGQLRESVVGITTSIRFGDSQRQAESVDSIWQIINESEKKLGYAILPQRKSRARGEPVSTEPIPTQEAPVNWQDAIDRALKLASHEGRIGNWDRGFSYLSEAETLLSREGLTAILPWEFYSLRGVLITHRAFQQNDSNQRRAAVSSFGAAWNDCNHAMEMAPDEVYPILMVCRIYNNLATPQPGQAMSANELNYLRWSHNRLERMIEEHQKGTRPLDQRQRAQCQYLLGYVHQIAQGRLCNAADGRVNYTQSWNELHSRQVEQMLQTRAPDSVDIWNEFDELVSVWERRRSTVCHSCQAAKKCLTCK